MVRLKLVYVLTTPIKLWSVVNASRPRNINAEIQIKWYVSEWSLTVQKYGGKKSLTLIQLQNQISRITSSWEVSPRFPQTKFEHNMKTDWAQLKAQPTLLAVFWTPANFIILINWITLAPNEPNLLLHGVLPVWEKPSPPFRLSDSATKKQLIIKRSNNNKKIHSQN